MTMQAVPIVTKSQRVRLNRRILFKRDLEELINKYNMEQDSDTPHFILADYLMQCLDGFNQATNCRDYWYRGGVEVPAAPLS